MRNDDRRKLLADYAVALVAERESWERLHEANLTEAERCRILGEWKQVAAALKMLVRQLRDAPAAPVFLASHPAQSSDAGALVPNLPAHAEFESPAVRQWMRATETMAVAAGQRGGSRGAAPINAHPVGYLLGRGLLVRFLATWCDRVYLRQPPPPVVAFTSPPVPSGARRR